MGLDIEVDVEAECPFRSVHPNTTDSLWSPGSHAICGALDRECIGFEDKDCPVSKHSDGVRVRRARGEDDG
jgi:hypothetical protein